MENQKIKLREYKFRGLRSDGKGWIYGDLVHDSFNGTSKNIEVGIKEPGCYPVDVIAESVGQLLHVEKSGYEWFEGDFAKIEIYRAETGTPFGGNEDEFIGYATGEVCLHIRHGLCLKNYRLFDENNGVEVVKSSKFKQITMSRTVIIGNVHEHKHLLTDGKEN